MGCFGWGQKVYVEKVYVLLRSPKPFGPWSKERNILETTEPGKTPRKANHRQRSMPDMTGRPGCRTMEMFGGSTASYLARTPRIPSFVLIFIGLETKNVLDYQGRAGSTSIVQWTLRPVIFGVEKIRGVLTFKNFIKS